MNFYFFIKVKKGGGGALVHVYVWEHIVSLKANMKSYIQLETAAIFFLANLFLKQGIG